MSDSEPVLVEIRGDSSSIRIQVSDTGYRSEVDEWDYRFVEANITATVPGFTARFTESFDLGAFRHFHAALKQMNNQLQGDASLAPLDDFLQVDGSMNALGHIAWTCILQYPGSTGAQLRFEMQSDQSYLLPLLRQLEAVFERFQ